MEAIESSKLKCSAYFCPERWKRSFILHDLPVRVVQTLAQVVFSVKPLGEKMMYEDVSHHVCVHLFARSPELGDLQPHSPSVRSNYCSVRGSFDSGDSFLLP